MSRIPTALARCVDRTAAPLHRLCNLAVAATRRVRSRGPIWTDSVGQYEKAGFKIYWETLDEVRRYQSRSVSGDGDLDPLTYALKHVQAHVGTRGLRALSIGCTEADPGPEMSIFRTGWFAGIDVLDIAEGLLQKQAAIAAARGLSGIAYRRADLNRVELAPGAYDFIWAVGTVHHVEKLEFLFGQIARALTPRGVFMMREYVGPSRFQFTAEQLALANELLQELPEAYRLTPGGQVKKRIEVNDPLMLALVDPSEAVRSADILPVMRERLDVISLVPTGGTLLHLILDQIGSNFERDEAGRALLRLLIRIEALLVAQRLLPSDYVFALARAPRP